jgi:RNA polymerase sigma factor (sigma-70 family)
MQTKRAQIGAVRARRSELADDPFAETVARAQLGDTQAFDWLVRRLQDAAVAYARTQLPDPAAAEDAAQEAFVRAWQDLPRLREPAAFGAWLRRLVFKYCDRIRRSARPALPLSDSIPAPGEDEPEAVAQRNDRPAGIHFAIDALPAPLREATLLYYLTGHSVREIGGFLELPPSTVKNRLHAARKRLRKELWQMDQNTLSEERPSRDDEFAGKVLARVLREFQRQYDADPHTADRGLLDRGRTALFEVAAADGPLDRDAARDGIVLLWRKRDWPALTSLLMRYLGQPLPASDVAWAYLQLANALAASGSAAGAVLAHEAFEARMRGEAPRLSAHWPYLPASEGEQEETYAGDEVRLLFLSQSCEFTTSYLGVWRPSEYLAKVDAALAAVRPTPGNRTLRFCALRMASNACEAARDFARAQTYVQRMYGLADEEPEEDRKAWRRAMAIGHEVNLARARQDGDAFEKHVTASIDLLKEQDRRGAGGELWVRGERHDLACQLMRMAQYERALALFEANEANGHQVNSWGWLMHAAATWRVTQGRERTLTLLREAAVRSDGDMVKQFAEQPEFADVKDAPDFLAAASRPAPPAGRNAPTT